MEKLIAASGDFMNQTPRSVLQDKTPHEAREDQSALGESPSFTVYTYMRDTYVKDLEKAHGEMRKGNSQEAYKLFANVVERLLTDKVPYFPIFRIYANAAVCSAQEEEKNISDERKPADVVASLGGNAEDALLPHEVLIAAALRINPQYDFGIKMKKNSLQTQEIFSHMFPSRNVQ